jgi:hypothetical protein
VSFVLLTAARDVFLKAFFSRYSSALYSVFCFTHCCKRCVFKEFVRLEVKEGRELGKDGWFSSYFATLTCL